MKWYEFEVGFYVEATNEEQAFHVANQVQEFANKIDPEGDAVMEFHGVHEFSTTEERSELRRN